MPKKGLAMLIVDHSKPSADGGGMHGEPQDYPEHEETPGEDASGDGDYSAVAGDMLDAIKAGDQKALATALQALCGMMGSGEGPAE